MKPFPTALSATGFVIVTTIWLGTVQPTRSAVRPKKPRFTSHAAVAFDISPPLETLEQFIPDKVVVIHHAVESTPERQGSLKGPGSGLGTAPPAPPPPPRAGAGRNGGR